MLVRGQPPEPGVRYYGYPTLLGRLVIGLFAVHRLAVRGDAAVCVEPLWSHMTRYLAHFIVAASAPHLPVIETREGEDIPTVTKALAEWMASEGHSKVRYNQMGQIICGDDALSGITVIVREYPE